MANSILTREQVVQSIMDTLKDVTKDIPEKRRAEVQGKILDSFATAMFYGHRKAQNNDPF